MNGCIYSYISYARGSKAVTGKLSLLWKVLVKWQNMDFLFNPLSAVDAMIFNGISSHSVLDSCKQFWLSAPERVKLTSPTLYKIFVGVFSTFLSQVLLPKCRPIILPSIKYAYAFQLDGMTKDEMSDILKKFNILSPLTGNDLTEPIEFNLMFQTQIGPSGLIKG